MSASNSEPHLRSPLKNDVPYHEANFLTGSSIIQLRFQKLESRRLKKMDNGKKKLARVSVLTDEQRKAHHIASEQKRRENIRSEFDKIVTLTPTLNELENRSELNILSKSADYIDLLKEENANLIELCRQKGIEVPNEYIYKGPGGEADSGV